MSDKNPLLNMLALPPFQEIKPEHIEPALDQVLARCRSVINDVAKQKEPPVWQNFVQPLEEIDDELEKLWAPVSHLNSVMDSDELRDVYENCLPKLSDYETEAGQNRGLFEGFKKIKKGDEFKHLDPAQRKIIDNALRDFRLAGVDLPEDKKARYKEIQQALSQICNKFSQNILDATDAWSLHITDEDDLAGLPASVIAVAKQEAERSEIPGWKFTLHSPSYVPFMNYADNERLRREFYETHATRASELGPHAGKWDNGELMPDILKLRSEEAELVGFENYSGYSLATKMAKDAKEVERFLLDLVDKSKPAAQRELQELHEFVRIEHGVKKLESWNMGYYSEKLRQSRYDFSEEDVRPYFPVDKVLQGMFDVVARLFGIRVRSANAHQLWHEDVRFFEIFDENESLCGRFFVDLFARAHKRGGAWMADCVSRRRLASGDVQTPVAFLVCNFTQPVGDKPSLLTHDEVITIFHEFGHGLHHLLTKVDYLSVSGIAGVAWDAVELPSQFLENWCWEREALDMISGHFETGEKLPDELLDKMRDARNFQAAMQMLRQIEFSLFDLRLHSEFDVEGEKSIQDLLNEVRRDVAVVFPPEFNRFQNSFSHIFAGGYAAGYYSYKWAEVLSADAFSRFEEDGIFNAETGKAFRRSILEQGGSRDPLELFVAFRGREPSNEALLRHSGLAA